MYRPRWRRRGPAAGRAAPSGVHKGYRCSTTTTTTTTTTTATSSALLLLLLAPLRSAPLCIPDGSTKLCEEKHTVGNTYIKNILDGTTFH